MLLYFVICLMDSEVITVVVSINDQFNLISNISLYSERAKHNLTWRENMREVSFISFDLISREKLIVFGYLRSLRNLGFKIYVIFRFSFLVRCSASYFLSGLQHVQYCAILDCNVGLFDTCSDKWMQFKRLVDYYSLCCRCLHSSI